MVFIVNSPTCSHCGLMVADCVCQKVGNQSDESDFASFGLPHEYLDENGNLIDDDESPVESVPGEEDFAAFGLPHEYLEET